MAESLGGRRRIESQAFGPVSIGTSAIIAAKAGRASLKSRPWWQVQRKGRGGRVSGWMCDPLWQQNLKDYLGRVRMCREHPILNVGDPKSRIQDKRRV